MMHPTVQHYAEQVHRLVMKSRMIKKESLHCGFSICAEFTFTVSCFLQLQGYNIISVLRLEIVPIMELLASMKSHSVPEDIDVSNTHAGRHTHTPVMNVK